MQKVKRFLNTLEPWQGLIAVVSALVAGFSAITAYIKTTALNAVLEEKFLAKLSQRYARHAFLTAKVMLRLISEPPITLKKLLRRLSPNNSALNLPSNADAIWLTRLS